ncbi:MAG: FtsQ-type POTRA domain-containing protein [Anaerolineae bacterium]|nr:FtsQ-type POTRA domain-containing protein [Anaerolineae bacterium]
MTSRPPERRRPPQAIPMRGAPTPTDQPEPDRPRNAGFVRPADVRAQESMSLAERRRQRRLHKAVGDNTLPPIAVPRNLPLRIYVSMRWFSAMITVALLAVLYLFLSRDMFFIHEIYVGGTRYLTPPEIFERSGLANMHIFWVDPAEVESKLKRDPAIADANVEVGWPPNMIQITITEREPALIWEQAGQRVWVDVRGRVMALRQDIPDLVRVVVEKPSKEIHLGPCSLQGMNEVLGPSSCIDPDIVAGVIQFKALYPNVTEMVYDPNKGLGYHDGRGWVLWFGNGIDIVTKMAVYQKIVESLLGRGITPIEVDVSNPDAPYYSAGVTKR